MFAGDASAQVGTNTQIRTSCFWWTVTAIGRAD